jgi:hypothetical protein
VDCRYCSIKFGKMLRKPYWPLMNADERGFKNTKALVFDLRLSAFISGPKRLFRQPLGTSSAKVLCLMAHVGGFHE